MSTVIAAIDNSPAARSVLAAASAVAELFHSDVEALHVRENGDRSVVAAARAAGIELREIADPTVDGLVHEAEAPEVAALVVGTCGFPAARIPAGHVALEVATSVAKPLIVVPPGIPGPVRTTRILVPLDGTRATAAALDQTLRLAAASGAELAVLHVHEAGSLPRFGDQRQYELDVWGEEFLTRYGPRALAPVRLEVRVGKAADTNLEVAGELGADLIALGWSQDLSPGKADVIREVLRRSPVPTLLVPVTAYSPAVHRTDTVA